MIAESPESQLKEYVTNGTWPQWAIDSQNNGNDHVEQLNQVTVIRTIYMPPPIKEWQNRVTPRSDIRLNQEPHSESIMQRIWNERTGSLKLNGDRARLIAVGNVSPYVRTFTDKDKGESIPPSGFHITFYPHAAPFLENIYKSAANGFDYSMEHEGIQECGLSISYGLWQSLSDPHVHLWGTALPQDRQLSLSRENIDELFCGDTDRSARVYDFLTDNQEGQRAVSYATYGLAHDPLAQDFIEPSADNTTVHSSGDVHLLLSGSIADILRGDNFPEFLARTSTYLHLGCLLANIPESRQCRGINITQNNGSSYAILNLVTARFTGGEKPDGIHLDLHRRPILGAREAGENHPILIRELNQQASVGDAEKFNRCNFRVTESFGPDWEIRDFYTNA